MSLISRRTFLANTAVAAAGLATAACTTVPIRNPATIIRVPGGTENGGPGLPPYSQMYAGLVDDGFAIPPVPYEQIPDQFLRKIVRNTTGEPAGTVVVSTADHFLYYTQPDGTAVRYGVGLGRAGFEWSGRAVVQWKQKWPTWTPPDEMIARQPELAKYSADNGGMEPGLTNPLGARALYIFQNGKDTLYRLHGSPEWNSIGKSVSSGCVRLLNQDIIDLYSRVPSGTPIVVR